MPQSSRWRCDVSSSAVSVVGKALDSASFLIWFDFLADCARRGVSFVVTAFVGGSGSC